MSRDTLPSIGDVIEFSELRGYKLSQNRPTECRTYGQYPDGSYGWGCKCDKCDGETVSVKLPVAEVIHWMDNSIEIRSEPDSDGKVWRSMAAYPSGDACY